MSQLVAKISPLASRSLSTQDIQVICQPYNKRIKQPEIIYTQVSQDSRNMNPNGVFVALRGTKVDGHDFIEALTYSPNLLIIGEEAPESYPEVDNYMQVANTRKILGPLAQAFAGDPWQHLQVIGITGTNGKTTTATLLYELLLRSGKAVSLLGTVSKRILDREIPSALTTSDPIELANDMQAMVNAGSRYLVMEVSSHALDQYRVNGIPFTIAIFTNITHDHLDYHGDLEAYIKAKKKLFDDLKPGSWTIINADDPFSGYMVKDTNAQIFSIGLTDYKGDLFKKQPSLIRQPNAQYPTLPSWAQRRSYTVESLGLKGTILFNKAANIRWEVPLIGLFNAYNALQAITAAELLGINSAELEKYNQGLSGAPGRLERVRIDDGASDQLTDALSPKKESHGKRYPCVFVDYAHTPDALENICSTLADVKEPHQKLLVVFGAGGNRDPSKRPLMAEACEKWGDIAVVTTDNPRSEPPDSIIKAICSGFSEVFITNHVHIEVERAKAIALALDLASADDIVVIAGKGHESYQEIKGIKYPFDDRKIAYKLLKEWNEAA
tara:strand:+ start:12680 stop:14341 length:1662 start_codon:yes stop_codon:yes gene_type:complete